MTLKIKKLYTGAILPTRAHSNDAGLDLYTTEHIQLRYGEICKVQTGVAVKLPKDTVGMICDKSSIGARGIKVFGGIIDESYTGEIIVVVCNIAGEDVEIIAEGAKIAQLLVLPVLYPELEVVTELEKTDRGNNGFGSTDKKRAKK